MIPVDSEKSQKKILETLELRLCKETIKLSGLHPVAAIIGLAGQAANKKLCILHGGVERKM
jgi:hypothetical protein